MLNDLIFIDDFVELWIKLKQRGVKFIVSKFSFIANARTISSFTEGFEHANWWIVPAINYRRNKLITGHEEIDYETYVTHKYLQKITDKSILVSLGCGAGSHELKLANLNPHIQVIGYDISQSLIEIANKKAILENIANASFYKIDVYGLQFENESVDYFLFNASLHHFKNIESFINSKIKPALKKGGLVIINEYVGPNRMNFPKEQILSANQCLDNVVSQANRKILGLNKIKNRCYRLGRIRMIISDPSECVDSQSILPVLNKEFKQLELKKLGGNILMLVLKHIAHHFVTDNQSELSELIKKEDEYLLTHDSDLVFGVYQKE